MTLSAEYPKDGLIGPHPRRYCCDLIARVPLERLCHTYGSTDYPTQTVKESTNCTCVDYLYCRLVVLAAFSGEYFKLGQDMIASVQHNLPNTRIIIYDLGLTAEQQVSIASYCNVELRFYDHMRYSRHAKDLYKYAWKPIITAQVSKDYDLILYGDASLRIFPNFLENLLPSMLDFPYASGPLQDFPIISLTHDSTMQYLDLKLSRQEAVKELQFSLNAAYCLWATDVLREKFLKPWVDCALHEDCIAPAGTSAYPCTIRDILIDQGQYAGCHRFDRSASSIILYREFGRDVLERFSDNELTRDPDHSSWILHSSETHHYNIKTESCMQLK